MTHLPHDTKIAIIGAGAVGCYYGARLARHGLNVHFLMRSDFSTVKQHGLYINSIAGDFHLPSPQVHLNPTSIGPCDLVIIALKSTQNHALIKLLPPLLKPSTVLLTLQNGIGNEDFLASHFPDYDIVGGLCFVCINRTGPGVIHHIAQGQITLGDYSQPTQPRTHLLATTFRAADIPCSVDDSLARARWMKLVWNIPFNGLSIATGGHDTASILASPALSGLVASLMSEVIATANALGHDIPESLAEQMITRTRTMTNYRPSSLIDYQEGREVEIEAIWETPCRLAREAGHPMHQVEMLLQLLQHSLELRANQATS